MDANKLIINPNTVNHNRSLSIKLRSSTSDIKLKYGSGHVTTREEIKYLGVQIDHKLNFLPQIKILEIISEYWNII